MADHADVRRLASALPGVVGGEDGSYRVNGKLLAWPWLERVDPTRRRVPNPDVLVVRVADEEEKHSLIGLDPQIFFTEPHYDGYSAVLVRLRLVPLDVLERLLRDAWQLRQSRQRRK